MSSVQQGVRDGQGNWQPRPTFLLDVNVLIALLDPLHTQHEPAHRWFEKNVTAWASCALTQNGFLRIVSHPRYPNSLASPSEALPLLADLCARPEHQFWVDDVSLLDAGLIKSDRLLTHGQLTDTWLLALAVRKGGQLATFDKRLVSDAVVGGRAALHIIDQTAA